MAFQHFYSRVPARISLYNKTDGFDTFAHSAALGDEFILNELAPIYKEKLRGIDLVKVRRGELSPIYFQCPAKDGVIQSALSYISRDYTGERSAYLVHSLLIGDDEREKVFANKNAYIFNPDMFITDISRFNVTASNGAPNRNYPPISYVARPLAGVKNSVSRYDEELVRSFIYAVIMCACGKGKNIFFRLPYDDSRLSREALNFLNSVMAILPYSFREKLSFVTYITDPEQHENFNLKCMASACRDASVSKGVFFDFGAKTVLGVSDEEARANRPLTGFFYMLFDNSELRSKFHDYIARITETYGADTLELKTLSELVFLFWQCSGFYTEQSVLPNDAMVYEFFVVFEKYKDALDDEYRSRAYKCLQRYPREHLPIPEMIFSKLKSIYPTEKTSARRTALNVILSLIHTDAMRRSLFEFIKKNYADETPEVKKVINEDLCRVFYGGFLQDEILAFFDSGLAKEPAETQALIVNKMLLAIRTADIQRQIVSILSRNYEAFGSDLRIKIYNTFFEMLPECDALSMLLIDLVNANVNREKDDLRNKIAGNIVAHLDMAYRYKNQRMLATLTEKDGFCEDVVIRAIFTRPNTEELYADYIRLLSSATKRNKATKLIHIFRIVPELSEETYEKLLADSKAAFGDGAWASMYDLINADLIGATVLPVRPLTVFRELILYPAIVNTLYDVFKVRYGKDGIRILKTYAEGNAYVTESAQYKAVEEYVALVEAAKKEDTLGVFARLTRLPSDPEIKRDISDHIRMCSLNRNEQSQKTAILFELCINALRDSGFRFDAVYTQYKNAVIQRKKSEFGKTTRPERVMLDSIVEAIELILGIAIEICEAHRDYVDLVCSENSGITRVISNFVLGAGFGGAKYVRTLLAEAPDELREIAEYAIKESKSDLPPFTERVKQLFRS